MVFGPPCLIAFSPASHILSDSILPDCALLRCSIHLSPTNSNVHAGKHTLRCQPQALALNCDSTRMSVIDLHGVLSFYDFHMPPQQPGGQGSGVPTSGEHLAMERKVSCNKHNKTAHSYQLP